MIVAFFFTPYLGHINKSLGIALHYAQLNYKVFYFICGQDPKLPVEHPNIEVLELQSKPWGIASKKHASLQNQNNIYENYLERKVELESVVQTYAPGIFFLDEFCVNDFLIFYPHLQGRKLVVLTPFFPSYPNKFIPPLHLYAFPSKAARQLWQIYEQLLKEKWKRRKSESNGNDVRSIVKRVAAEVGLPLLHTPEWVWQKIPYYPHVEKWHLQPVEADFTPYPLRQWERYVYPKCYTSNKSNEQYELFKRFTAAMPHNKIIFCSLGTVTLEIIEDADVLVRFYQKFVLIAQQQPQWFVVLNVPPGFRKVIKPKSMNLMTFEFVPYTDMLKSADVFVTHTSGTSYLEAIEAITPMLTVPPAEKWDYNGNAARIVHHGWGLKANFTDTSAEFTAYIEELLNNQVYRNNLSKTKANWAEKYGQDYYQRIDMPHSNLLPTNDGILKH